MSRTRGRHSASSPPERAGKVAVGSRAEAKALRERELAAQRAREKAQRTAQREGGLSAADEAEGRVAWSMLDAGAVLAMMLASLLGSDAILSSRGVELMPAPGQALTRAVVLGVFHVLQLGLLAFLASRRGTRLLPAFGIRRGNVAVGRALSTGALVVLLVVATRTVSTLWGAAARAVGWEPPQAGMITAVFGEGGWGLLATIVIFVVVGPLAEELVFRGVVLRAVGGRWGQWPAILVTAGLFALYHFEAWTFVPLLFLGIALGWLAWSRRSLRAAVALHALYNGVVVGAAYWLAR